MLVDWEGKLEGWDYDASGLGRQGPGFSTILLLAWESGR